MQIDHQVLQTLMDRYAPHQAGVQGGGSVGGPFAAALESAHAGLADQRQQFVDGVSDLIAEIDPELFRQLDIDGDRHLSADELAELLPGEAVPEETPEETGIGAQVEAVGDAIGDVVGIPLRILGDVLAFGG